jgi:hypothetical protein
MKQIMIKLHDIAHARAGDKGNRLNISVIAYSADAWPFLLEQVTTARVEELFKHRGASRVARYELPNLHALNFVIDDVLEGGVNSGLALDTHGKTNSFRLLGLTLVVPVNLTMQVAKNINEPWSQPVPAVV